MHRVAAFLQRLRRRLLSIATRPYEMEIVEGWLPLELRARTFYVVKDDGIAEHVAFICPCGCGDLVQLNLLPDERPCWQLMCDPKGRLNLHPSVWRTKGCHAHFWVRGSRIGWCGGAGGCEGFGVVQLFEELVKRKRR